MDIKKKKRDKWFVKAFVLAFMLTLVFGLFSQSALSNTRLVVSIVLIVLLMLLAVVSDLLGTATIVCDPVPFRAMGARKIKGAKQSLALIGKAEIVASICCDVVGDISAIMSGAIGAGLAISLASNAGAWYDAYLSILISAIIASIAISLKALSRGFAKKNSAKIIRIAGLFLAVFGARGRYNSAHIHRRSKGKKPYNKHKTHDKSKGLSVKHISNS